MNLFDCISAAEKDIYNARRYLETRSALLRVCDNIYSAMMWAMEAWIIGKGHEPDRGNGWGSIHAQFLQLAPREIGGPASYCAAQAVMLNYDQEGGLDHKEKPLPIERWEKMTLELIDKAERCIVAIAVDSGCSEKQLKELCLYGKFREKIM